MQTPTRRATFAILAAAAVLAASQASAQTAVPAAAKAVHDRLLTLDSHVDVLLPGTNPRYFATDGTSFTSLDKLKAGGVDAVVYAVAVSTGPRTAAGYAAAETEAKAKLAWIQALPKDSGGAIQLARTPADIRRIVASGKIAVLTGFLNAYSLGEDLSAFDPYFAGGVRVAGLTHAGNNAFADSSRPQAGTGAEHGGLSPLGKAAIARFNDLGVLVDVSQLTPDGLRQTLAITRAPVVASHSAARALVDVTRNLSDAELDAIKANGGVVQVPAFNSYLAAKPAGQDEQPKATLKAYVDHIDYIAKRIGVDHVGVGTDFNHGSGIVGFADASQAPAVTAELLARGYSQADLAKIWGENFLRVLGAAQAAAKAS